MIFMLLTEMSGALVALVTGGTRGIGKAVCALLAESGYSVAVVGRSESFSRDVASSLAWPDRHTGIACDVGLAASVQSAFEVFSAKYSRIDALVNCAGAYDVPGLTL